MKGEDKRDEHAAALGRKAARLLKRGKPQIERLVEENRPRVQRAGKQALRFAQEHEDEIKRAALKGVRMRAGPLGMAVDALGAQLSQPPKQAPGCASCGAAITRGAKFCNQCGTKLGPGDGGAP